ncbi:hypothetical protein D3C84_1021190 [compost metagenome]
MPPGEIHDGMGADDHGSAYVLKTFRISAALMRTWIEDVSDAAPREHFFGTLLQDAALAQRFMAGLLPCASKREDCAGRPGAVVRTQPLSIPAALYAHGGFDAPRLAGAAAAGAGRRGAGHRAHVGGRGGGGSGFL